MDIKIAPGKGNIFAPGGTMNGRNIKPFDPLNIFGGKGDKNNVAGKHAQFDASPLGDFSGGAPLESTTGEPLPDSAEVGGGPQSGGNYAIFGAYRSIFGRNPTAQELAAALPYQNSGDPNFTNQPGVNAYVANLASQLQNTPEAINKRDQARWAQEAPQHFDAVNQLFTSQLGREASKEELNHFGMLLSSGTTDPYGLQTFLQQQPEFTQKQDAAFRGQLTDTLSGFDKQYFQESILPSLQQTWAKQGRSFDSSGFQGAATQSAQQQNIGRQQYIAGLAASQYTGRQTQAYQDYSNMLQNQQQFSNANLNAQYGQFQNNQGRSQNLQDVQMQSNLYNQYLAQYGKRSNGVAQGAVAGAGIGTGIMPGWGTAIGAVAGGIAGYAGGNY